jgi:integrase
MATVSFLLKEPKADRPTPIFAFVSFDGQRVKVYSGLSIHPKQWVKAEQRAQLRGYPANSLLNDALELLQEKLLASYAERRSVGATPTAELLRTLSQPDVEQKPQTTGIAKAITFWDYFDEWIALARSQGKARSAMVYKTTARHLRSFASQAKFSVTFDSITPAFGDKFTLYLLNKAGLTDNTIAKQVATLKRFLKHASDRGYHASRGYEQLNWKRQEPEIMTLTAEEVQALEALELTGRPYLDNARNLFLLSCYTGLRYSDLVAIRPEHLKGATLRITTQKTRETVTVPLRPAAQGIVKKYFAGDVHPITNQRLNDYLKELGKLANIITPIEVIKYRAGKRNSTTFAKWERLGCHTGRRTFVTLALERGLRPEVVMKVTGHRDWKSFKRYINIIDQTVEKEFARAFATVGL